MINLPQLVFEVTDNCNLNCSYCGYGKLYQGYDPRKKRNLSFKKACNTIDYLARLWKENINDSMSQQLTIGFYGGEPLINIKLIKELIQYIESLSISEKNSI